MSSAKVVAKQGSQSRFGHVTMKDEKEAANCIKELNGKELKGAKVTVEMVTSYPPIAGILAVFMM